MLVSRLARAPASYLGRRFPQIAADKNTILFWFLSWFSFVVKMLDSRYWFLDAKGYSVLIRTFEF